MRRARPSKRPGYGARRDGPKPTDANFNSITATITTRDLMLHERSPGYEFEVVRRAKRLRRWPPPISSEFQMSSARGTFAAAADLSVQDTLQRRFDGARRGPE